MVKMNFKFLLFVIAGLIMSSYYTNDVFADEENIVGQIQWLEMSYPSDGTAVIRVIDLDMNLDPKAVDNFDVYVWSDFDAIGTDPTVTETGADTGIFEGTVFFTTTDESSGHRLRVLEGDTIIAKYEDRTLPDPYTTADQLDITAISQIQATSLKQQLADNIPEEKITCSSTFQVLTERPNGDLACVYPSTAAKLEWHILNSYKNTEILPHEVELKIEKLWETEKYFSQPESVLYDSKRDIVYVSNINGLPDEQNGIGFLSKLSLSGKLIESNWIDGLDAPKGMAIFDDKLYVSDLTSLVEIDIENNKILNRYDASESIFLNDVTADDAGNVYVSDTFTDAIYRLQEGIFEIWLQTPELKNPNGLLVDDGKLIVGSWGVMNEDFTTDIPGHLIVIDLESKSISDIGDGSPLGNLDGVESDGTGNYYVTDWMAGKMFHVGPNGDYTTILELELGSADHDVIVDQNMIIIPMMQNDVVVSYGIS